MPRRASVSASFAPSHLAAGQQLPRPPLVLDLVQQLRSEGNAVILITHNMEHVIELADRAVVLRQGRKVGELKPDMTNRQDLVSLIVGAET